MSSGSLLIMKFMSRVEMELLIPRVSWISIRRLPSWSITRPGRFVPEEDVKSRRVPGGRRVVTMEGGWRNGVEGR